MKTRYILSTIILSAITGFLHGERIAIENGQASLEIHENEPLTFSYESRQGAIRIVATRETAIHVEIRGHIQEDLPGFLYWDDDNRIASIKLLGDAANHDKVIHLPANSHLKLMSVQDDVFVSGITGDIEISTVNGDVHVEGSTGSVVVEAIDGDISLSADLSDSTDPVYLSTVDGNIRMEVPAGFRGDFELATLDGSLSLDLPDSVTINRESSQDSAWVLNRMRKEGFALNTGGRRIILNSVDGDLSILSR